MIPHHRIEIPLEIPLEIEIEIEIDPDPRSLILDP